MAQDESQKVYRVLVVDDSRSVLDFLQASLETAGNYEVLTADTAAKGMEMAKASHPDLILFDVTMPVIDGFKACRFLKGQSETRDIPIIFVSGRTLPEDMEKGYQVGASDFLTKPVEVKTLLTKVRKCLGQADS